MGLINRLAGIPEEGQSPDDLQKIHVEYFYSMLYELAAGKQSRQNVIDFFSLNVVETTELDWLITKYNALLTDETKAKFVETIRVLFVLAEAGRSGYTTNAELVARINLIS